MNLKKQVAFLVHPYLIIASELAQKKQYLNDQKNADVTQRKMSFLVWSNATEETIKDFIKSIVNTDESLLITDGYRDYNSINKEMKRETINRSQQSEVGGIHTNTIESFRSFVKRAWYGSHHHYSTAYTPLYLTEACCKYNHRETNIFENFLTQSMK